MHFAFTDEQKLLQESVERFVENDYPFDRRRASAGSDDGFSREIWAKFAELGWLGLGIPEDAGGHGGSPVETSLVMEALGRALAVEPYTPAVVMTGALLCRSSAPEHRKLLAGTAAGKVRIAFALAERRSRYDLARVTVTATADREGYVLDGAKSVALHADSADRIALTARTSGREDAPGGITVFLVDSQAAGLSRRGYPTVDGLRAAEVTLDRVRVGGSDVVGTVGEGLELIEAVVDAGTVSLCAEASGIMKHMYESTLEYLRGRQQFGQPLASFQALQHRIVDMFVAYELSRSMAYQAAVKLDAPRAERRRAVSSAKVQIGKAGRLVGQESIQLHGGMGMTDEMAISHYFKRLTMIDRTFGDVDHHLDYLVEHLEE